MRANTPDEAKQIFYDIWKDAERDQRIARRRRMTLVALQLAVIAGLCTIDISSAVSAIHGFIAPTWEPAHDK